MFTETYLEISGWVNAIMSSVGRENRPPPLSVSTPPQTIIKHGFLFKKAHNKWTEKYFVLERTDNGTNLMYYDGIGDFKRNKYLPKRVIPLW